MPLQEAMDVMGQHLGLAYQMTDDHLDMSGGVSSCRPKGSMVLIGRPTLPVIFARDELKERARRELLAIYKKKGKNRKDVNRVIKLVASTEGLERTKAKAEGLVMSAMTEPRKAKEDHRGHEGCGCCDHELEEVRGRKKEARIKASGVSVANVGGSGEVLHITDDDFDELRQNNKLLVVDFWAEWCGPCMAFGPVLERFAKAHPGEVVVGKMNVDENQRVPGLMNIESIPSIVFFKDGRPETMVVGAVPLKKLEEILSDIKGK